MAAAALALAACAPPAASAAPLASDGCADCHAGEVQPAPPAPAWGSPTAVTPVPLASSAMCLACHDGARATAAGHRADHPVQVDYERARGERRAFLRSSGAPSGLGGSIADDLLVAGRLECVSCHDPHGGHGSGKPALRVEDRRSALCFTCHDV